MYGKHTQCVHSGSLKEEIFNAAFTPPYPSTAYDYFDMGINASSVNSGRPNQRVVKDKLCALEHGEDGIIFNSGLASLSAVLIGILKKGDHVIFQNSLRAGIYDQLTYQLEQLEIAYSFTRDVSMDSFKKSIIPQTRLICLETPSNPLLQVVNMAAIAQVAQSRKIITLADNTLASPLNQNPLDHGIDIVIHHDTRYLGGHGDLTCGAVISSRSIIDQCWKGVVEVGGTLDEQMAFLLERGLKTLALRVSRQNQNAMEIAKFLVKEKEVSGVIYPGLESHPDHHMAKRQMNGFGGIVSFEIKQDPEKFIKELKLIRSVANVGGIESSIMQPARNSHSKLTGLQRKKMGISNQLLRLSAGIEDAKDLIMDLAHALNRSGK